METQGHIAIVNDDPTVAQMLESGLQAPDHQLEASMIPGGSATPDVFREPFGAETVRRLVEHALCASPPKDDIEVFSASPRWLDLSLRCKRETADRVVQ